MSELMVAIAFGSNLGGKQENIARALELLQQGGLKVSKVSKIIESTPVDCPAGSDIFQNGVLCGLWSFNVENLLKLCQNIEKSLGRPPVRGVNSPRTIDLDILLFGDQIIDIPFLQVPHPRMLERDFVMQPLLQIVPDWLVPGTAKTVQQLMENRR